jgi:hypothetical protein
MSFPDAVPPNILLYFYGIEVLFIAEHGTSCDLGIVGSAEGHTKFVQVLERGNPEPLLNLTDDEIAHDFYLVVNNEDSGGIHFWRGSNGDHYHDFDHVVDFESSRIYGEPVRIDLMGFSSFFHMTGVNDALFFTEFNSTDGLLRKERGVPGPATSLGSVAVAIGANIPLDPKSRAVFTHGTDSIGLSPDSGKTYEIWVSHGHSDPPSKPPPNDSVFYDQVILSGVSGKKIDFALDTHAQAFAHSARSRDALLQRLFRFTDPLIPPALPHAICFTPVVPRPIGQVQTVKY